MKLVGKLVGMVGFGVGYVLGTKAGRERYEQIRVAAKRASTRLEDYSRKLDDFGERPGGFHG